MAAEGSHSSATNVFCDGPLRRTPSKRSKVWQHFEQDLVEVNGNMKDVCKYCGLKLTSNKDSGTNSLRNHIAESCPRIPEDERHRFIATMKKRPTEDSFKFDPTKTRELLGKWCISAEIPFNKFDDPFFAPAMESLQPSFSGFGRQTMRNDSVDRYQIIKEKLRNELQSLDSRICFTSDLWTSNQKLGYICLTAHYIDASFVLKKKIISFKYVKYPHTGLAVEEAITGCLLDWGIKDKMFTITLDNASNNMTACDLLCENGGSLMLFGGEHLYIRCCAHILNLLVQDGMKIAKNAIHKIRELVRHIVSSPSRIQAFNEIAQRLGLRAKAGLILDVPNRWNSTYDMIMEAITYKVVLKRYAEEQLEPSPDDPEWKNAEAIGQFLGAFEEATRVFSAYRSPTAHLFLHNVLCIHQALRNREWQVNYVLEELAYAMDDKFDKYWDEGKYNMVLVIATILDPTKKMNYLQWFYEKTCREFVDIETSMILAKTWFKKYFEEYEKLVQKDNPSSSNVGTTMRTLGSPVLGKRRLDDEFAEWSRIRGRRIPKSELEAYLEEESVRKDERFEILNWWKTNANKYPVLSAMARDFLAIPLSTVASESAFSASGRILGENRSSMSPQTLESLVCGKDWLYEYPNVEGQQV